MNVLLHSVHPSVPSGYGQQTRVLCKYLPRLGHKLTVSCSYGMQGWCMIDENNVTILPVGPRNAFGQDTVGPHYRQTKADVVVSLLDVFVFQPPVWKDLNWWPMMMIDADPLMTRNRPALDVCRRPIAVSRFGERVLQAAGYNPAYVPLMVDPDVFKPKPQADARAELAALWHRPLNHSTFIVAVNSANVGIPGRKNWDGIFGGWAAFLAMLPEQTRRDCLLYLHTDTTGTAQGGMEIDSLVDLFGLDRKQIMVPPQWEYASGVISSDVLARVYAASDLYLNPSVGEGFGLPTVEAQMCGCPVAVTNFSASVEVCQGGWLLDGDMTANLPGARQCVVKSGEVARVLYEALTEKRTNAITQRRNAALDAAMFYSAPVVLESWSRLFDEIEDDMVARQTATMQTDTRSDATTTTLNLGPSPEANVEPK